MSIKTTYNIYREDAIDMLRNMGVEAFDDDCNERLEYGLDKARKDTETYIFENYDVVDYDSDHQPPGQEWDYWLY